MMLDAPNPKYLGGQGRRRPCLKTKQGWGWSSTVEHFPSMQEALDYMPRTGKKKYDVKEDEHDKKYNGNAIIQISCRNNTYLSRTLGS